MSSENKKLRRVIHVSYSKSGGAGLVANNLSEYQQKYSRYSSELITRIDKSHFDEPFVNWKITKRAVIDELLVKKRKSMTMISLYRNISDLKFNQVLADQNSLLHLHWLNGVMNHKDVIKLSSIGIPIVWNLHDMEPFTGGCHQALNCQGLQQFCQLCPEVRKVFQASIRKQHQTKYSQRDKLNDVIFVSPSEWLKRKAQSSTILGRMEIQVVKNPINEAFYIKDFTPNKRSLYGILKQDIVIGIVSNNLNFSLKNYLLLKNQIKSINQFSERKIILLALGRIKNSKKDDNILELGYIKSPLELAELYHMMDFLISTSEAESFGLTVAEAAACGIPSLVLAGSGAEEILRDTQGGMVFNDFRELRNILINLGSDKNFTGKWQHRICKKNVNQYRINNVAEKYDVLYQKALKKIKP